MTFVWPLIVVVFVVDMVAVAFHDTAVCALLSTAYMLIGRCARSKRKQMHLSPHLVCICALVVAFPVTSVVVADYSMFVKVPSKVGWFSV